MIFEFDMEEADACELEKGDTGILGARTRSKFDGGMSFGGCCCGILPEPEESAHLYTQILPLRPVDPLHVQQSISKLPRQNPQSHLPGS